MEGDKQRQRNRTKRNKQANNSMQPHILLHRAAELLQHLGTVWGEFLRELFLKVFRKKLRNEIFFVHWHSSNRILETD